MGRLLPQRTIVVFGDGAQARAFRVIPNILGDGGELVYEFHFWPTREMQLYHDIDDRSRSKEGFIVVQYPSRWVEPLNDDPVINTIMVMCDFSHGDTQFTRGYPDPGRLDKLMRENRIFGGMVARLEENKLDALRTARRALTEEVLIIKEAKKTGPDKLEEGYVPEAEQGEVP